MAFDLHRWRRASGLTQIEAAEMLGVSQTYMSLLETRARPLTPKLTERLKALLHSRPKTKATVDENLRSQLAASGYLGFAHVKMPRRRQDPTLILLTALRQPDVDGRVTEALPWFASRYGEEVDWAWLVRQAKLHDFQNRLGFLLELSLPLVVHRTRDDSLSSERLRQAKSDLDKSRLLNEATFCWDSMAEPMRRWMRSNRSLEAEHWNILTRMGLKD